MTDKPIFSDITVEVNFKRDLIAAYAAMFLVHFLIGILVDKAVLMWLLAFGCLFHIYCWRRLSIYARMWGVKRAG
ncbi:MAG: hypothetical protein WC350_06020 [Candidatus Micrarchaeia archaeon]|jgi:hypothetical protein